MFIGVQSIVQGMFDCISEGLACEGNIEIRKCGIFSTKSVPEHKARKPKTGETITVPSKNLIRFKPGLKMREIINQEDLLNHEEELSKSDKGTSSLIHDFDASNKSG